MKLIDMLVKDGLNGLRWPEGAEKATSHRHIRGVIFWDGDGNRVYYRHLTDRELSCEVVTREQYEAALAYKNDGWIGWAGGECPVEEGTRVDVRYRNGEENHHIRADISFDDTGSNPYHNAGYWDDDGSSLDIIAYRLHKQKEAEQDKANPNECIGQDATPAWSGEGLPPVGCFCEVEDLDGMLVYGQGESGEVIAHVENTAVIRMSYGLGCFEARFLSPIRTEAERKRDAAVEIMTQILCSPSQASATAKKIYDAIAAGKIPGVKLED